MMPRWAGGSVRRPASGRGLEGPLELMDVLVIVGGERQPGIVAKILPLFGPPVRVERETIRLGDPPLPAQPPAAALAL